jgi:hypothetical protein
MSSVGDVGKRGDAVSFAGVARAFDALIAYVFGFSEERVLKSLFSREKLDVLLASEFGASCCRSRVMNDVSMNIETSTKEFMLELDSLKRNTHEGCTEAVIGDPGAFFELNEKLFRATIDFDDMLTEDNDITKFDSCVRQALKMCLVNWLGFISHGIVWPGVMAAVSCFDEHDLVEELLMISGDDLCTTDVLKVGYKGRIDRFDVTPMYRSIFTYGPIPSRKTIRALSDICAGKKVLSVGCGCAFTESLLRKAGVDIEAVDDDPILQGDDECRTWMPVEFGDGAEAVEDRKPDVLMLVWPHWKGALAGKSVEKFTGDTVIYIGEASGGCTGDGLFFDQVDKSGEFVLQKFPDEAQVFSFISSDDLVYVYKRKQ